MHSFAIASNTPHVLICCSLLRHSAIPIQKYTCCYSSRIEKEPNKGEGKTLTVMNVWRVSRHTPCAHLLQITGNLSAPRMGAPQTSRGGVYGVDKGATVVYVYIIIHTPHYSVACGVGRGATVAVLSGASVVYIFICMYTHSTPPWRSQSRQRWHSPPHHRRHYSVVCVASS